MRRGFVEHAAVSARENVVRINGRAPIRVSELNPAGVVVAVSGGKVSVRLACPDCGRWQGTKGGALHPHQSGGAECPASRTRVLKDVSPEEFAAQFAVAAAQANALPAGGRRMPRRAPRLVDGGGRAPKGVGQVAGTGGRI